MLVHVDLQSMSAGAVRREPAKAVRSSEPLLCEGLADKIRSAQSSDGCTAPCLLPCLLDLCLDLSLSLQGQSCRNADQVLHDHEHGAETLSIIARINVMTTVGAQDR